MDIKEKEELIKLVGKYLEETRQKVKKWGHLESCPYIEKLNTISKMGCYLMLEIKESKKQGGMGYDKTTKLRIANV